METDQGIIIRLTKLTETSLIVTWVTECHGLIRTVAKGARRAKSPFAGKLDLFFSAELSWVPSRKSELHTLREVVPTHYRQELRINYVNTELAAYFTSLLETIMEPDIAADDFHDLLTRGLNYLCSESANLKALLHFEKQTAQILGIFSQKKSPQSSILETFGRLPTNRARCHEMLENSH